MRNPVAYVVLSHQHPAQVQRLVGSILRSSPDSRVLVACDTRGDTPLPTIDDARVKIYSHGRRSDWGSWELVEATLDAFVRASVNGH